MSSHSSRKPDRNSSDRSRARYDRDHRSAPSSRNTPQNHRPQAPQNRNGQSPQRRSAPPAQNRRVPRNGQASTQRHRSNPSQATTKRPSNQRPNQARKRPSRRRNLLGPILFLLLFVVSCVLVFRACSASHISTTDCKLEFEPSTLIVGETTTVTLAGLPAEFTGQVLWSSNDTSIVSIADGVIEAKSEGEATIAATVEEEVFTATVKVVNVAESVQSLKLNYNNLNMISGKTYQLESTVMLVNNEQSAGIPVLWSSSNPSVARVSNDGLVTARDVGTASITATVGNQSAVCVVKVTPDTTSIPADSDAGTQTDPLEDLPEDVVKADAPMVTTPTTEPVVGLALSPNFAYLCVDETLTLNSAVSPSNAVMSWSSSDRDVATVSATGVVTAKSVGSAVITVSAGDLSASCSIEVTSND